MHNILANKSFSIRQRLKTLFTRLQKVPVKCSRLFTQYKQVDPRFQRKFVNLWQIKRHLLTIWMQVRRYFTSAAQPIPSLHRLHGCECCHLGLLTLLLWTFPAKLKPLGLIWKKIQKTLRANWDASSNRPGMYVKPNFSENRTWSLAL